MEYWVLSDTGCVRTSNQDAYVVEQLDKNTLLCVVCDGMGGAKSGDVASALAADVFSQEVKLSWKSDMDADAVDQLLLSALKLANFTVYDQSRQFEEFSGMGTTMVAALVQGKGTTVLNVGDSRAYQISEEGIFQISVDHSLVQLMVDRGEITPEQAKTIPVKNYITRAVGTESSTQGDLFHETLEKGTYLLLCSDGLTNLLDDQEILFEVIHGADKQACCQTLVEIAKHRGAPDNVTCVLVEI
jgi:protein phosphatase